MKSPLIEKIQLNIIHQYGEKEQFIKGEFLGEMGAFYGSVSGMHIDMANLIVELVNNATKETKSEVRP